MNLYKLFFLVTLCLFSLRNSSYAQRTEPENVAWTWIRVDGRFAPNSNWLYWSDAQFRFNDSTNNAMQTMILRPMVGYQTTNRSQVWMGVAFVESERDGEMKTEIRPFQMLTISDRIDNTPIVYLSATRVEQRFFDDRDKMEWRFRQLFRVSIDLFSIQEDTIALAFQNEVLFNERFDQNRLFVGADWQTGTSERPVTWSLGYIRNDFATRVQRGIQLNYRTQMNLRTRTRSSPLH